MRFILEPIKNEKHGYRQALLKIGDGCACCVLGIEDFYRKDDYEADFLRAALRTGGKVEISVHVITGAGEIGGMK